MKSRFLLLPSFLAGLLSAQTVKDCRTVYLTPMPESLDEFIAVELHRGGPLKVVASEAKADCVASFGRLGTRTAVRTSGSHLVPSTATAETETVRTELPAARTFFNEGGKSAAISLVHRESSTVVWADSKADGWSFSGGAKSLAQKLVEQLKKDFDRVRH